ncbi:uncharacterized protein LOC133667378 isoform X2 [Apis cerana]|nr:uncharacterized protein LOC133667378 isoform X2 [Apis cerana]
MLLYLFFLYIYYKRINFLHYFVQANSMIRLRGGRDHIWMPLHVDSSTTNVASFNGKFPKKVFYPLKDVFFQEKEKRKLENNKNDKPMEVNNNKKKIKCLPIKFQKLMFSRNNTKSNCHFIQNIEKKTDSSKVLNVKKNTNFE